MPLQYVWYHQNKEDISDACLVAQPDHGKLLSHPAVHQRVKYYDQKEINGGETSELVIQMCKCCTCTNERQNNCAQL